VTISLHAADHLALGDALVVGEWDTSDGLIGGSCTTDQVGSCNVSHGGIRKREGSVVFSVTSHPGGEVSESIIVTKQ